MVREKTLFVLLDAFRHDYINPIDTPFLYSKLESGVYGQKLKSTAGFTQRTAIYTGATGEASGAFTMFTFDADASPFNFVKHDPRLSRLTLQRALVERFPAWPGTRRVRRLLHDEQERQESRFREFVQLRAKTHAAHASVAHIPFQTLPAIGISEDAKPIYSPGALACESIFDVFHRENLEFEYVMFPEVNCEDEAVIERILEFKRTPAKILLAQFSDTDLLVHECGPSSQRRRAVVGEADRRLREIDAHFGNDLTWIIIGDHGMTDVLNEFDIPTVLKPLDRQCCVRPGTDYLLFLDSTMARFRWLSKAGREFLEEVRHSSLMNQNGRFVDEQLAQAHSIPVGDRRYGDLMWWANQGVLLFPDFFHDRKTHNRGMHGYDSSLDDMKGFFLAFGPDVSPHFYEEVNLIDVCPSICAAAGVTPPLDSRGTNLLGKPPCLPAKTMRVPSATSAPTCG